MTDRTSSPPVSARPGATPRPHEAQPQSSDGSWVARRRRQSTDDAARRLHDEIVARGAAAVRTASSTALTVLASVVLGVAAVVVGLLVWATVVPKGLWGWLGIVAGWAFVAALVPRPVRLSETVRLEPADFPATHRLLADLAEGVGAPTPADVHLDAGWGVEVVAVGWTRRPTLVVGLPLWTCLTDDERVALVCHELGHVRGGDGARAALVGHAHGLLDRLATLLTPLPRDAVSDLVDDSLEVSRSQTTMNGLGRLVLTVVSAPAVVTLLVFERAASRERQQREYAADLRAAEVAGTAAVVRLLLTTMGLAGVHTLAGAAARRREDPFTALDTVRARPDLTDRDIALARSRAREHDLRWDAAHPRDDLRLGVLEAHPTTPEPEALADRRALARAADAELAGQRTVLARRLRDELLDTWR